MEERAYHEMAEIEAAHWWFAARRQILAAEIERIALPANAQLLEVGAGTGGNMTMLSMFGKLTAVEADEFARQHAEQASGRPVLLGYLPDGMPSLDIQFDLICMFDVLEHVAEAEPALRVLRGLLKPGGSIMISVPAYKWLWSDHDVTLHHFRRYTTGRLAAELSGAGFAVKRLTYFNSWLFPLAVADRLMSKLRGKPPAGMTTPSAPLNGMLQAIMASETAVLHGGALPFGLSVFAVASPV